MNDFELLRRYTQDRSEAAFAELVKRHVDFVYSAALRQVGGDAHLAEDVAQSVFVDLARKAASLTERTVLSGWLYTGARYAAAKAARGEQRRRAREQESFLMQESAHDPAAESSWEEVRPVLDSAMHALGEPDRNAVLLRYFENRPLAEVGAQLGLSEDAARMRLRRALDKLRGLLGRRGVSSTSAAALGALLAQQTVSAAPAGLAANIAGTALAGAAVGSAPALTLVNLMNMTKLKIGIVTTVVVAGVATPLAIQEHARRELRGENAALRQQIDALTPLASENERLSNLLANTSAAPVTQTNPAGELLKLRGEVGRLREENRELARLKAAPAETAKDGSFDGALQTLAARATQVQEGLKQMPHRAIPELQFLTTQDWLRTAGNVNRLETEEDFRKAFSDLRVRAKAAFAGELQNALRQFVEKNDGMLPADLSQLQPYLDPLVDRAVLERYQLLRSGKLSDVGDRAMLVGEKAAPVDTEYDTQIQIGLPDLKVTRLKDRGG